MTVTIARASGPTATLQGTTSYNIGTSGTDGTITSSGLRLDTAGTYTLSAATTSFTTGTSGSFTVSPTTATVLAFTTSPSGAKAGSAFSTQPVVQTEDAFGNLSTVGLAATVTVTIAPASGPTATLQGTTSYNIGTGGTDGTIAGTGLRLDTAGTYTLGAAATNFTTGTSGSFTVSPTTATVLAFTTSPSGATAGIAFSTQPVVQTEDAFGNFFTVGLAATVTVMIARASGPTATLQGTTSYNIGTGGTDGTITGTGLRLDTAGTYTLRAAATGFTTGTSGSFTVSPATATVLAFTTNPSGATAGSAFSTQPVVQTEDAFGNFLTVGLAATVTVMIARASGPTATLQGTTSYNIGTGGTDGTITGTGLRLDTAGTYTLSAAAPSFTTGTSNSFTVSPTTATVLTFTTAAQTLTAGGVSNTMTVEEEDQFGNVTTTAETVNLSSTNTITGVFKNTTGSSTITSVSISAGSSTASFKYLDTLVSTPTLTAAATGLTSATQGETVVAATNRLVFTTTTQTLTAGVLSSTITVQEQNQLGNAITTAETVNLFSTNTSTGVFKNTSGSTITSVSIAAGSSTASFKYIDTLAGTPTLTAAATGFTSATQGETVKAAAATHFSVSAPSSVTAGSPFSVTVTALDQFNNIATGYTGTVHFSHERQWLRLRSACRLHLRGWRQRRPHLQQRRHPGHCRQPDRHRHRYRDQFHHRHQQHQRDRSRCHALQRQRT